MSFHARNTATTRSQSRITTEKMNDLAGLDWNASSPAPPLTQSQSQAQYSAFRPAATPTIPRQPTPLLTQASGPTSRLPPRSNVSGKAQANDSFANLLGPSASKTSTSSLSLQERQKQLLAERPTQSLGSSSRPNQTQVNSYQDAHFWEGLGSGRGTPAPVSFDSSYDSFLSTRMLKEQQGCTSPAIV